MQRIVLAALAMSAFVLVSAEAAVIGVTTGDDSSSDTRCTLRAAIESANTNTAVGGCNAGDDLTTIDLLVADNVVTISGDRIELAGNVVSFVVDAPAITGPLEIAGPGIIDGGDGFPFVVEPFLNGVRIDSLTLQNFRRISGGGLVVQSGAFVTIRNSTLRDNSATIEGGAVLLLGGILTIIDSAIQFNSAELRGGGVFAAGGSELYARNATFLSNTVSSGQGGGVRLSGALGDFRRSTFRSNQASDNGGGISTDGFLVIDDSLFEQNSSGEDGGALYAAGDLQIAGSSFLSNTADRRGGGIFQDDGGTASIVNSTVFDNSAGIQGGGGIHAPAGGTVNVSYTTFDDNEIAVWAENDSSISIESSIIGARTVQGPTCVGGSLFLSISDTIDELNDCPGASLNIDPQLEPLALFPDALTPTLNLQPTSPAIDRDDTCTNTSVDQTGFSRPFDGDGDGEADCDWGAVEFRPAVVFEDRFESSE